MDHEGARALRAAQAAWKQRVRTLPGGQPRRNSHAVLLAVRSFYLDLLQWSLDDPDRWAQWAAPRPISEADVRGYIKDARRRRTQMAEHPSARAAVSQAHGAFVDDVTFELGEGGHHGEEEFALPRWGYRCRPAFR